MKVSHFSTSDQGGAPIAAVRIVECISTNYEVVCRLVLGKRTKPSNYYLRKRYTVVERYDYLRVIKSKLSQLLMRLASLCRAKAYLSPGIWPTYKSFEADCKDSDIIHLHWVQGEFINSDTVLSLTCPVIWTLHDMWPILGCQHYPGKLSYITDLIEHWCLRRKNQVPDNLLFHCTTAWMEAQVKKRYGNCNTVVIPYPIDTNVFRPRDYAKARNAWGLPTDVKVILYGAVGGTSDYRKGWDLLEDAVEILAQKSKDFALVIFGGERSQASIDVGNVRIYNVGNIISEVELSSLYSTSDVMVVPSRIEAYGQTAAEAISCGVPVVAFDNSGLADVVEHGKTGFLAKSFSTTDLAKCIENVISDDALRLTMSKNCRSKSEEEWSYKVVSASWLHTYSKHLKGLESSKLTS